MEQDEVGTLRTLKDYRERMSGLVGRHGGRVINATGDSMLADFDSVVEAVNCATEVQRELAERNRAQQ
ncbi:MAG: hypothetical protein FJX56_06650 [Alphaproteobacteria bacterium]|nr:hypothetical protein [Alphaproteobacteria bacterium]